ncbi:MAG: hypothetical protein IJY01_06640 [Clostridia bacterium]|nr:hypothetical protein [Clostridia bacterium]
MTKTMRREQNRIRRRNVRACYTSSWIALALVVLIAIIAGFTLDARAQSSGVLFTQDDQYELEQQIGDFSSFTFESEFYISPDLPDDQRGGVLMSNWVEDAALRDGNEWGIEIHFNGVVRIYHQTRGSIFFAVDAETGENITNTTHDGGVLDKNVGSAADVRTYTTGGRTVKIAIVFYASAGHASLFINGKFVCKTEETVVEGKAEAIKSNFYREEISSNPPVFPASTANPKHVIGGDHRTNNTCFFNGHIKNLALYTVSLDAADVIASQRADTFSPDLEDTSLQLALDMTQRVGPRIPDLSANNNNAVNKSVTSYNADGYDFSSGDTVFRQESALPTMHAMTISAEVSLNDIADGERYGVIFGNYNNSAPNDHYEWALEIYSYGAVRLFRRDLQSSDPSKNYIQYMFTHGADGVCHTINASSYTSLNAGSDADVREYVKDGGFVKITVSIDTYTGIACLYLDGKLICQSTETTEVDGGLTRWKDRPIEASETTPYMTVGGDNRIGNEQKFKGKIRNLSVYSDILSEGEIGAYAASEDFSPDISDPNLVFAYDLRYADAEGLTDLSKNSIDAPAIIPYRNVTYTGTPSSTPATDGYGHAIASAPFYLYFDDDGDGVAQYDSAWADINGNGSTDSTKNLFYYIADKNDSKSLKCYVQMQSDFTQNNGYFNNMPYLAPEIFIDMNGKSITTKTGDAASLLSAQCKGVLAEQDEVKVTFFSNKSGSKITVAGNRGLIVTSAWGNNYSAAYGIQTDGKYTGQNGGYQCFSYTFEGIEFQYAQGAGATNPFVYYADETNSTGATSNHAMSGVLAGLDITLNDCIFNMANAPADAVLFGAKDDDFATAVSDVTAASAEIKVNSVINFKVNGGEIKGVADFSTLTLAQNNYYDNTVVAGQNIKSEVIFGKGINRKYISLTLNSDTEVPATGWDAVAVDSDTEKGRFNDPSITTSGKEYAYVNATDVRDKSVFVFANPTGHRTLGRYLTPSVQYGGRGDYVPASVYYSNNFAVFKTVMDDNGNDGDWEYVGSASYPFNGDTTNNTVMGLTQSLLSGIDEKHKNHVVAVLTKDCELSPDGKYSNFGQIRGKLTYDLGGYTLFWNSNTRLVNAEAKIGNYGYISEDSDDSVWQQYMDDDLENGLYHKTRFEMKNGRFITSGSTLIVISAYGTSGGTRDAYQYQNYAVDGKSKLFELDFSNVTFEMSDDKNSIDAFLIKHGADNGDSTMNNNPVRADITFSDCIFDLTNADNVGTSANVSTGKSRTLFGATDDTWNTGSGNINSIANITVNGGEIISKTQITDFKIADCFNITADDLPHKNRANNNQGASVTFGRGSSFKYPTVTFPAGSTHPFPVFGKDTGVYLGDLNVTSNTATAGAIGSLHVYSVGPKGAEVCTNAEHIVEYTNPQNLLTYSKNDKLIDGSLVFHLEASREEDGDVGQNYSTYIPAYYYDLPDEYPFYVIDKNNTCVGVYSNWLYAADKIETFNNGLILLKSDFTNGEHTTGNGDFSKIKGDADGNGGYAAGIFTIDLNGKTFTRGDSAYFIDLTLGGDAVTCSDKNVTVKNGTLVNNSTWGPICLNYNSDYYSAGEASPYYSRGYTQYTLTFDKVDFISSTGSPTFWLWENGYSTLTDAAYAEKAFLKVDATFNDCNITSTHATYPAIPMRMPYSHDSAISAYDRTIFNVTVDGGSVTAASGNAFERNVDINTAEGHVNRTDNIFFVDDTSGNYPTLTLPTAKGQPMHVFLKSTGHYRGELDEGLYKLDAGEVQLSYIKDTVSGDNTVYKMAEPVAINNIRTATKTVTDGKVIANYSTFTGYAPACIKGLESAYPFWVFDGAQMLLATDIYAVDTYNNSALQFADNLSQDDTNDRTVTVYLSADATLDGETRFTNLCYSYRAIAIDLGGHTVTVDKTSSWQALIYFEQKVPYDQRLVVVQNGSVELMNDASVVLFHTAVHDGNEYYTDHEVLTPNVVLKDLNIISNANHSEKAIVARPFATTTETQPRISADLKVINCTVDTSANANATVTLFDTADDYGRIEINPTLDGGSLIGNRDYGPFAIADDVDRMTFSNEVSGAYTTLTIPTASPRPLDVFKMNVGHGIFTEKSVSGDNTVYEIEHFQSLDLGIKTNLVFAQELLMMIYVPEDEEGNLTKFSLDGFEFRRSGFGGLNYRMIGGKKYYAVPVSLPAKEAARNIPVVATVGLDGAEFTVSFTVSLTKYASSVLSASTAPEKAAQKTLVLDTLAYIKSAYAYFNCADKTEVTAAIDEVLTAGGYSDKTLTKSEGTTVATGLTSHTLLLDSRPIIRLYVDKATYGESIFKFKQGDKDIPYITHYDSEGKIDYIDIALLAYRIPSEITYDIITEDREAHTTATVSGSYHINSYYDSAIAQNNATLTDIVTKFYLYCQSAKAYADGVIAGQ